MPEIQFRTMQVAFGGHTKRDFIDDRKHLVVPIVLLKEGVHNRVYYPEKFLRQTPQGWNGRPVAIGHPKGPDGNHISANSPVVVQTQCIGSIFGSKFVNENKSLIGESWLDEAKTEKVYPGLIARLSKGDSVEESTGLFTVEDPTPGTWNGEEYDSTALFAVPDHVAILPDSVGACSLQDGCGIGYMRMNEDELETITNEDLMPYPHEHAARVEDPSKFDKNSFRRKSIADGISIIIAMKPGSDSMETQAYRFAKDKFTAEEAKKWLKDHKIEYKEFVAASGEPKTNMLSVARVPSFDGTESVSWAGVATTFAAYRDAYYKGHGGVPSDGAVANVKSAPAAMKNWIASKTLLGDPSATTNKDLIFFPVVNPNTNHLNEGALRACLGGRASQADISQMAKDSVGKMARRLLDEHFGTHLMGNEDMEHKEEVVSWITRVLNIIRGDEDPDGEPSEEPEKEPEVEPEIVPEEKGDPVVTINEKVTSLINCPRTRFQESDSEWLNKLTDEQLEKCRAIEECSTPTPVVNEEEIAQLRVLADEAIATRNARKSELVTNIMSDKTASFTKEELESLPEETLKKMSLLSKRETTYVGQGNITALEGSVPPMPQLTARKN